LSFDTLNNLIRIEFVLSNYWLVKLLKNIVYGRLEKTGAKNLLKGNGLQIIIKKSKIKFGKGQIGFLPLQSQTAGDED
jgi:hypothetical protein